MMKENTENRRQDMRHIHAGPMHFQALNQLVREDAGDVSIDACAGQRYIGSGLSNKTIHINGTPGNALGAYLDGAVIEVFASAQDATGDTMNEGAIIIHGSSGDATGYAMRGGRILVEKNVGYRAGIHMKAYQEKVPVLVIGGIAGCFLGEYQAGGRIVVLGLEKEADRPLVGAFCATGMHGGKIFLRANESPKNLPIQVIARQATAEDMAEIEADVEAFCLAFGQDKAAILASAFQVLVPNSKNPYKQLYTHN